MWVLSQLQEGVHDRVREDAGAKAPSKHNQWAVNLYLGDASWSLCGIACSAVARIRLKAKVFWSNAYKSQAICISHYGPIMLQ